MANINSDTIYDNEDSQFSDAYKNHQVFEEIKNMMKFYDGISNTSFAIIPSGTATISNYDSYIYTAIRGTLDSIQTLLKIGRINDAYVLVRKYSDDALLDIYIDVIRKDKFDWIENVIVGDVDEWIRGKQNYRIPARNKVLSTLEQSPSTNELYKLFGGNSYFNNNRETLNDSVHGNRYLFFLLNSNSIPLAEKEKHLHNIHIVLKQIFVMHMAFIFHLNPQYMMASDYSDYLDCGMTPPEGSQYWISPYAQEAFDKYIKPNSELAQFIKNNCSMALE